MLADPAVNLAAERPAGGKRPHFFYADEVCDPVQEDTYAIDGVRLSDFVYPEWFETNWAPREHRMDHRQQVHRPFQVHRGGYIDVRSVGGWREIPARRRRHRARHRLVVRQGRRLVRPARLR